MMTMTECVHCHAEISYHDTDKGKRTNCPHCMKDSPLLPLKQLARRRTETPKTTNANGQERPRPMQGAEPIDYALLEQAVYRGTYRSMSWLLFLYTTFAALAGIAITQL